MLLKCLLFNIVRGLAHDPDGDKVLKEAIEKALKNGMKLEAE